MADPTAPESPTPTSDSPEPTPTAELGDPGKAALDAERKARREAERQAKAAQKELEELRAATMSENEKALSAAKAEGRTEALREAGSQLVNAEIRAAAAGRNVDVDALLEGVDTGRFVGDTGSPDRDAITAWVDRVAPKGETPEPTPTPFPDLGQGARTPAPTDSISSHPFVQALTNQLGSV